MFEMRRNPAAIRAIARSKGIETKCSSRNSSVFLCSACVHFWNESTSASTTVGRKRGTPRCFQFENNSTIASSPPRKAMIAFVSSVMYAAIGSTLAGRSSRAVRERVYGGATCLQPLSSFLGASTVHGMFQPGLLLLRQFSCKSIYTIFQQYATFRMPRA